jgi:hypothetical protein
VSRWALHLAAAIGADQQSNCQLLDVAGSGSLECRRVEWDGAGWTNESRVAKVETCVGPGCGYNGGGAGSGFAGELDDGHLMLSASDGKNNRVYLVE